MSTQNTYKNIINLNNTLNQLNIIDIYGSCYPATAEYNFLFRSHETFTKMDDILGYTINLNKYLNFEITQTVSGTLLFYHHISICIEKIWIFSLWFSQLCGLGSYMGCSLYATYFNFLQGPCTTIQCTIQYSNQEIVPGFSVLTA